MLASKIDYTSGKVAVPKSVCFEKIKGLNDYLF